MVEARRIELLSENRFMQLSTSVVYLLEFPDLTADKQAVGEGSPDTFLRCGHAAETFTTTMMPQRRSW